MSPPHWLRLWLWNRSGTPARRPRTLLAAESLEDRTVPAHARLDSALPSHSDTFGYEEITGDPFYSYHAVVGGAGDPNPENPVTGTFEVKGENLLFTVVEDYVGETGPVTVTVAGDLTYYANESTPTAQASGRIAVGQADPFVKLPQLSGAGYDSEPGSTVFSAEIGSTFTVSLSASGSVGPFDAYFSDQDLDFRVDVAISVSAVPKPDLATDPTNGLSLSANGSGIDYTYSILDSSPAGGVPVAFYWASGPSQSDILTPDSPANSTTLTGADATIDVHTKSLAWAQLGTKPTEATHLVMVLDPADADHADGLIEESDEGNNVASALITPDVAALGASWDLKAGRLKYQFEVEKPVLNRDAPIYFDWIDTGGNVVGHAATYNMTALDKLGGPHTDTLGLNKLASPPDGAASLRMTVDPAHAVDTDTSVRTVDLFKITPTVSANKDTPGDNLFGTYLQGVKLNVGFTAKLPAADAALQTLPLSTQYQMKSASQSVGSPVDGTKLNPTSWLSTQNVGLATDGMGMTVQFLWGKAAIGEVSVPFKFSSGTVEAAVKAQVPVAGSTIAQFTALSAVRYLTGVNPDVVVEPDFRAVLTGNGLWYARQLRTAEINGNSYTVTPVAGLPGTFEFHAGNVSLLPAGNQEIKFGFVGGTGRVIEAGQTPQTILMTQVPTWLTGGAESYDPQTGKYHLGFGWKKSLFDEVTDPHLLGDTEMPEGWTDTLKNLDTNATLTSDLKANVPVLLASEPKFKVSKATVEATVIGRAITPKTISTDLFNIDGSLDARTLKLNGLGISLKNPYVLLDATTTPLFHGSVTIPVSNGVLYSTSVTLSVTATATVKVSELGLFAVSDGNGNLSWDPTRSQVVIKANPTLAVTGKVDVKVLAGLIKGTAAAGGKLTMDMTFSAGLKGELLAPEIDNPSLHATLSGSWFYHFGLNEDGEPTDEGEPDSVFGPIELF